MPKIKNEKGNRYGKLTVIEYAGKDKYHNALWKCKCDCGNEIITAGTSLRQGNTKSCGCLKKEKRPNFIDETGNRYGRLVVIKEAERTSQKQAQWLCKCDCGKETIVRGSELRNGKVKSCGCLHQDIARQMGKANLKLIKPNTRFGRLIVNEYLGSNDLRHAIYRCTCDCGNVITVDGCILRRGQKSCGCAKSKGELYIQELLKKFKIPYKIEYKFDDCKGKTYPLKFDFYINNQYLIEFDGGQHFYPAFGEKQFKITQEYDNIKNEYCKTHNIPLIRIPYWHYDKITIDDLRPETSQFLI